MTEIFSNPGSRTVYTTAPRYGLPAPSDVPPTVGPASYNNNANGIKWLEGIVTNHNPITKTIF